MRRRHHYYYDHTSSILAQPCIDCYNHHHHHQQAGNGLRPPSVIGGHSPLWSPRLLAHDAGCFAPVVDCRGAGLPPGIPLYAHCANLRASCKGHGAPFGRVVRRASRNPFFDPILHMGAVRRSTLGDSPPRPTRGVREILGVLVDRGAAALRAQDRCDRTPTPPDSANPVTEKAA